MKTPEDRGRQLAVRWFAKELPSDPERALAARVTRAIRAAVAEAVAGEREAWVVGISEAAKYWNAVDGEHSYAVRALTGVADIVARSRGEGE